MRPWRAAVLLLACLVGSGCLDRSSEAPTATVPRPGDLRLLLEATYPVGANMTLRLENDGAVVYRYSYVAALDIDFRDSTGRAFRPPEAMPPTTQYGERIGPGETRTLFLWHGLRACTENQGFRGGCTASRPLGPGDYSLSNQYPEEKAWKRSQAGGGWGATGTWANATFSIL